MKNFRQITRRNFLKGTAAAGAVFAIPAIVQGTAFGANAPSNRIVMGAIGVGSQGTGDMQGFLSTSIRAIATAQKGSWTKNTAIKTVLPILTFAI